MPKFLENPGVLTKDRLKSELKSQGITLPKADQRKQVYVDLYLEHLTSQNDEDVKMFSSDEEDDGESNEIRKPAPSRTKHLIRKPVKGLPYDVNALSDGDLARQLRNYGQVVGPITDTTRPLYQKKLIKILQEEMKNPETFHEQLKPPLQQAKPWEFSENEEDEEEEEEPAKPVSVSRKQKKKSQEEVVMIEDHIDAVTEVPKDMTPPKESTPKVDKRETIVSEYYLETRKRAVANNKSVDSAIKSQKLPPPVKPSAVKQVDGSSWEWKAVLVVLALITTILLVYYFMEGSADIPQLKSNV